MQQIRRTEVLAAATKQWASLGATKTESPFVNSGPFPSVRTFPVPSTMKTSCSQACVWNGVLVSSWMSKTRMAKLGGAISFRDQLPRLHAFRNLGVGSRPHVLGVFDNHGAQPSTFRFLSQGCTRLERTLAEKRADRITWGGRGAFSVTGESDGF